VVDQPKFFDAPLKSILDDEAARAGETVDVFVSRAVALRIIQDLERRDDPRREAYRIAFAERGLVPPRRAESSVIDDPIRLRTVAETGMLDIAAGEFYENIVALAAEALGVPLAAITVVDRDRQVFWSSVGMTRPSETHLEIPLERSISQFIVATGEPLIVGDAPRDPILAHHPAVVDRSLAAFLGFPLTSPAGQTVGALSVGDTRPRYWAAAHLEILEDLASRICDRLFPA
jgi:hypothetical protein